MKSSQSKNIVPANSKHSSFFQKESRSNFFGSGEKPKSFFSSNPIQAKLTIGKPNDPYEKEADAMAEKVVQRLTTPEPLTQKDTALQTKPLASTITPFIQTKWAACEQEEKLQKKENEDLGHESSLELRRKPIFESNTKPSEEENNVHRKCAECEKEDEQKIQTKNENNPTQIASTSIESNLNASKGIGSPLPETTRTQMESSFGADFSGVRIHNDSLAAQMSKSLNAQAFTHGSDIYFNSGKYNIGSPEGTHLLSHELTHVVQQQIVKTHSAASPADTHAHQSSAIQRDTEPVKVPEIDKPSDVPEWQSPGGEKFQWENKILLEKSYPNRADGLRSFLMVVKELDLRGLLGSGKAMSKKEIQQSLEMRLTELKGMDDKALITEVNKVFENYADTDAFPPWVQKAVRDYSGMKYQSAHGSFFSPQHLLTIIKTQELERAGKDEKDAMMAEATAAIQDESLTDLLPAKTAKKLKGEHAASSLTTLSKKIPKSERDSFEELLKEDNLWGVYLELQQPAADPGAFSKTQDKILELEGEIAAMESLFSKQSWKKIIRTRELRKTVLLKISREIALQKIRKLNNLQAVGLLNDMHDEGLIPDEAWKEIMGHTELRLQASSLEGIVTERRALKKVARDPLVSEETWQQWKMFLQQWYKGDATGWREEHRDTLSANVVTTLVCDQLGSVIQNIRGVSHPGGLRKNANAYVNAALAAGGSATTQAGGAKSPAPVGTSTPFFKRPASLDDFPVGASIFWATWSDVSVTQDYMKIYKQEEEIGSKIKFLENQIKELEKKKSLTSKDNDKIKKHRAEIKLNNEKLVVLKKQQEGMLIYTPEKDKTPDISNVISPMQGAERQLLEKGKPIKDCMVEGDWTYSVNDKRKVGGSQVESIMRAKLNPFYKRATPLRCPDDFEAGQNKEIVKQWLVWQHEATVMFVIPETNKVITFDTSFKLGKEDVKALGTRVRSLDDLVNKDNVFVGFMPGKVPAVSPVANP